MMIVAYNQCVFLELIEKMLAASLVNANHLRPDLDLNVYCFCLIF